MKQDHRRVSKEKHEIAYMRSRARYLIKLADEHKMVVSDYSVKKLAKAYLKSTKGYTRKKK